MTQIRLCTRRQVIVMDLLEALSKEPRLSPLRLPQQSHEKNHTSEEGYYAFVLDDQSTMIYVIIDQSTSIPYLLLEGPKAEAASRMLQQANVVETADELMQRCREARHTDDKIDVICRLGIASYFEVQPDILDVFHQYMLDGDVRVRQSAVFATSFIGWIEFEPMLADAMELDPDTRVSAIAESAIRIMRESDWRSTPDLPAR
ncbi:hypothetical protein ACE3MZ_15565 [Paenibacillus sp. WLX1005]|uniref:hypothetical protein n=1 Tax=Paenibacillus sp. WLX1005 TaxID=3243766 RepID=UPI00398442CF